MQKWVPGRHFTSCFQCCAQFYIVFIATYILGYNMYLTTRKILTDENGEGSNTHTLPCGIRGVRQRLRMC